MPEAGGGRIGGRVQYGRGARRGNDRRWGGVCKRLRMSDFTNASAALHDRAAPHLGGRRRVPPAARRGRLLHLPPGRQPVPDETCPLSTGGRTRRVHLVQGEGGAQDLHSAVKSSPPIMEQPSLVTICGPPRAVTRRSGGPHPPPGGRGCNQPGSLRRAQSPPLARHPCPRE